jgi:methionyl-tRNA formyltransferase
VHTLAALETGGLEPVAQQADGVIYARKIEKHEASIDWSRSAEEIERQVRAFNPVPVASTSLRGEPLRIWRGRSVQSRPSTPGQVLDVGDGGVLVACGSGALFVLELQRAGGKRLPAADFLRGVVLQSGELLGA